MKIFDDEDEDFTQAERNKTIAVKVTNKTIGLSDRLNKLSSAFDNEDSFVPSKEVKNAPVVPIKINTASNNTPTQTKPNTSTSTNDKKVPKFMADDDDEPLVTNKKSKIQ
jgi:hypothetical protein